jgi:uncharacterized membrane protein YfcA
VDCAGNTFRRLANGCVYALQEIIAPWIFAVLMVLASISMVRGTHEYSSDDERFMPVLLVIQGILIGFLTGLVGAGGGFLIVPALVLLTGLTVQDRCGTLFLLLLLVR